MSVSNIQTTHLLVVYLSLVTLGVLLEVEWPQDPPDALASQLPVEDPRPHRALREDTRLEGGVDDDNKMPANLIPKSVSEPDIYFNLSPSISTHEPTSGDPVNLYHDMDGAGLSAYDVSPYGVYGSMFVSNGSVLTGNHVSDARHHNKPHTNTITRKIKVSTELNAFDELLDLLTSSTAHCLAVDSLSQARAASGGSRYRCYLHRPHQCERAVGSKTKRLRKRCSRNVRLGYEVDPASVDPNEVDPNEDKTARTVVKKLTKTRLINSNSIRKSLNRSWQDQDETTSGVEETLHKTITVNAHCTFLDDLKTLRLHQRLMLDIKFDLAGLNSLHKYEIIRKLVQELRRVLTRWGYQLVRSSADGGDLQQYLQQEGLERPLHVFALLHR